MNLRGKMLNKLQMEFGTYFSKIFMKFNITELYWKLQFVRGQIISIMCCFLSKFCNYPQADYAG